MVILKKKKGCLIFNLVTAGVGCVSLGSAKIGSNRQSAEFFLVYLFCMLDSTSCITYVEMLRVCNASIEL